MNHGHQFDAVLSAEHKAEQERKQKKRAAREKLEAAAPDLLAACKAAQLMLLQTDWNGDDRMNIVRDAIAKAE